MEKLIVCVPKAIGCLSLCHLKENIFGFLFCCLLKWKFTKENGNIFPTNGVLQDTNVSPMSNSILKMLNKISKITICIQNLNVGYTFSHEITKQSNMIFVLISFKTCFYSYL